MHRSIAILLGVALVATQSPAAALHIHVYTDHDHPEHHHGPALHEHVGHASAADDAPVIGACNDAGRHALTLACAAVTVPHLDIPAVEAIAPAIAVLSSHVRVVSTIKDVRVHGPPARTQAPPRAPPLISHL